MVWNYGDQTMMTTTTEKTRMNHQSSWKVVASGGVRMNESLNFNEIHYYRFQEPQGMRIYTKREYHI